MAAYIVLSLAETFLIRKPYLGSHFQPKLLWSWSEWEIQKKQILINVVMFVPVGMFTCCLWKWRGLMFATGLSLIIEILQLISARGLMELDDIIHNCLGALMGTSIVILDNMK